MCDARARDAGQINSRNDIGTNGQNGLGIAITGTHWLIRTGVKRNSSFLRCETESVDSFCVVFIHKLAMNIFS